MKNLKKSNLFSTCLAMLVSFSVIGFVGCEKESLLSSKETEIQDFLSIEGGLEGIATLLEQKNNVIYAKACYRLKAHLEIKGNKLSVNINNGYQVNVSEDIFQYYMSSLDENNKKIDSGELVAYVDNKGEIRLAPLSFEPQVRLKNGDAENDESEAEEEPIDVMNSDDPGQELWDRLASGEAESLSDLCNLDNIPFQQSGSKIGSYQMNTIVNDTPCIITIMNACMAGGNTFAPNNDCGLNDINTNFIQSTNSSSHYYVQNGDNSPLITFWFY